MRVFALYTALEKGAPMVQRQATEAVVGRGLTGNHPKRHSVTLIAFEAIEVANTLLEPENRFRLCETRRNVVTKGVDLNALVGKQFKVGGALLQGVELADPCDWPDKLANKTGFRWAFQNKGGLKADILERGFISVGDPIVICA